MKIMNDIFGLLNSVLSSTYELVEKGEFKEFEPK